jgi:phytoene dehydrogenase-like protein
VGVPRLPLRSPGDLVHDLGILGPPGLLAGLTSLVTLADLLRLLGLGSDRPLRAFVAMLLQDTAQAGPETVPLANAAACLQAYRRGLSRPRGGMRALVEGIGSRFAALGGTLRTATLVDRVEPGDSPAGGFLVHTRRRSAPLRARQVVFNLPLDRAATLLGRGLDGQLARHELKSRAAWSAVTGYVAIARDAVPDDSPLFHHVLQSYDGPIHDGNNVLVSLSPPGDDGYGPPDVRVATLSTHTRPADWAELDRASHAARKAEFRARLLAALGRALPEAPARLWHLELGTPRSFARYTRRTHGAVGGPPVARHNSNLLAVHPGVLGPGLWLVGDSVFPGQGTLATVLSAIRVVEQTSGVSWQRQREAAVHCPRPREELSVSRW